MGRKAETASHEHSEVTKGANFYCVVGSLPALALQIANQGKVFLLELFSCASLRQSIGGIVWDGQFQQVNFHALLPDGDHVWA